MAMATCWNCGARVTGPTCQMCGAAQQAGGAQGAPAFVPGGQPVVSQASMSVRPPQVGDQYARGGQYSYPPAGQAGGWQGPLPQPGYPPQPGYQQPGYQAPSAYQQQQAAMGMQPAVSGAGSTTGIVAAALLLPLVGGGIAAIVGAVAWAFILQSTKTNYYYVYAVLLGLLVGGGVLLGAGGRRHFILAIMAAVLGLFSFVLALYFRLSLLYADGGANLFALPVGLFFDSGKGYLQDNPVNYLYFFVVPLVAAGTTLRSRRRRR